MLPSTVSFPIGVAGAAEISMPVLCAATSASAFAIQEGRVDYVHSVYQYIGVKPEHYGEAFRQMSVAWSLGKWFEKPGAISQAVRPTERTIASVVGKLDRIAAEGRGMAAQDTMAGFFRSETYALLEREGAKAAAEYLEYSAYLSLRAGDIEATLTMLDDMWELLPYVAGNIAVSSHMKFAEMWARLGREDRAADYIHFVGALLSCDLYSLSVSCLPARIYVESGSFVRAAVVANATTSEERVSRFLAHLNIAREMSNMQRFGEAEAYIMNVCFPAAWRMEDYQVRQIQLQYVLDELLMRGMDDSVEIVTESLRRYFCNLDESVFRRPFPLA